MKGRHFLKLLDLSADDIRALLDLSHRLKKEKAEGREEKKLLGKNVALIFEKASTRTRCAFETASFDQGAHCTYLGPSGSQMGVKETMKDTARVLGRMYDGIEYRGFGQAIVEELAAHAGVPVWNGLTDEFHPTQVIADFQTMEEHCNKKLSGMKLTYMGDGGNNVAASLMVGSAIMGVDFSIGAPPSCQPDPKLLEKCREIAAAHETPSRIALSTDPQEAVHGADFIYTDVWVSMGEPESRWKERIELLRPYQVNVDLMVAAKNSACKFLHCLPAFHNRDTKVGEEIFQKFGLEAMEVTEDVFESVASVVFDQAENRLHSIKAVMVSTLAG